MKKFFKKLIKILGIFLLYSIGTIPAFSFLFLGMVTKFLKICFMIGYDLVEGNSFRGSKPAEASDEEE